MRGLLFLIVLQWVGQAIAGPLDTFDTAKPYIAEAIDLLALPSRDCDQTCELRSLVTDASITYGKLNDKDYAAVFFTVHTNKGEREMVLLMRVTLVEVVGHVSEGNDAPREGNIFPKPKAFSVEAVGPQIDGGKPTNVSFSNEGIIYSSPLGPDHRLELNQKGLLISKVVAPSYVGSKVFKVERESVYPADTASAVTLGMPFSMESIKSALPDRLKLDPESLEGVDTISTALGPAKDAGSIEIYAKDGKVDGIEVSNNGENALGVRIGASAMSIPDVRAEDCELDDLSGDYICNVRPEPYFYRLGVKSCPLLPKDKQWPNKPESIACMDVTGIAIGSTRM